MHETEEIDFHEEPKVIINSPQLLFANLENMKKRSAAYYETVKDETAYQPNEIVYDDTISITTLHSEMDDSVIVEEKTFLLTTSDPHDRTFSIGSEIRPPQTQINSNDHASEEYPLDLPIYVFTPGAALEASTIDIFEYYKSTGLNGIAELIEMDGFAVSWDSETDIAILDKRFRVEITLTDPDEDEKDQRVYFALEIMNHDGSWFDMNDKKTFEAVSEYYARVYGIILDAVFAQHDADYPETPVVFTPRLNIASKSLAGETNSRRRGIDLGDPDVDNIYKSCIKLFDIAEEDENISEEENEDNMDNESELQGIVALSQGNLDGSFLQEEATLLTIYNANDPGYLVSSYVAFLPRETLRDYDRVWPVHSLKVLAPFDVRSTPKPGGEFQQGIFEYYSRIGIPHIQSFLKDRGVEALRDEDGQLIIKEGDLQCIVSFGEEIIYRESNFNPVDLPKFPAYREENPGVSVVMLDKNGNFLSLQNQDQFAQAIKFYAQIYPLLLNALYHDWDNKHTQLES